MAWVYLLLAGMMEWGWPVGFKWAWTAEGFRFWPWAAMSGAFGLASMVFLLLAQRTIPMGTAYAVWTGIGAVGAFVLGILFFGEPAQVGRCVCVSLIIAGIVGLKLTSPE